MRRCLKTGYLAALIAVCTPASQADPVIIEQAEAAVREVKAVGFLWSETEALLHRARRALAKGDAELAQALAEQAHLQAKAALNQYHLERAKYLRRNIDEEALSEQQLKTVLKIDKLIRQTDGRAALQPLSELSETLRLPVPKFLASAGAYPDDAPAGAIEVAPSYRLRRVAGRPVWSNLKLRSKDEARSHD